MKYGQGTFTLPTMGQLDEAERQRRWRAAFGKPGACEDCGGRGYRLREFHEDAPPEMLGVDECWTCCGTGRGEHERG